MNACIEVEVCYIISEDDLDKGEYGMEIDFSRFETKKYKIYNIDYVTSYDETRSVISCAGLDFIVNETYDKLSERIEKLQKPPLYFTN